MKTNHKLAAIAIGACVALSASAASAGPRVKPSVSFWGDGSYTAGWIKTGGNPGAAMQLTVDATSYAGVDFKHLGDVAPTTPPSFDFKASVAGDSGGSPRLVLRWSDGGKSELRPLTWTTDWQSVSGANAIWDNGGGTCGFLYNTDYATTLGCHSGAAMTDAYLVTDSGWLNGPYTNLFDNVSIGTAIFSGPSNNGRRP